MALPQQPVLHCLVCQVALSLLSDQALVPVTEPPKEASITLQAWFKVDERGAPQPGEVPANTEGAQQFDYRICVSCNEDRQVIALQKNQEQLLGLGFKPTW